MSDINSKHRGSALHMILQAAFWTFAWTGTASALPCLEDKFGSNVNCTANDIRVTEISNIVITDDGCASLDDTVTFDATLTVVTTATSRYDIGLFIGEDGVQAQNGECSVFALPTSPTPPYSDLDSDACGDSKSSATLDIPVTNVTVACNDSNGDNELDLATCTSWRQNKGGTCGGAADVVAGTASKCNCPSTPTDIPIFVPDPVCVTNADCEALATGCNVGICDVANPNAGAFGCTFTPTDSLCDDDLFCNGDETCDDDGDCIGGSAPDCDDDVPCTDDACNESTDSCVNTPDNSACDDGFFCNGEERCDEISGCASGTALSCDDGIACTQDACSEVEEGCVTSSNDLACNDQNDCTADTCDPATGCEHESICESGICRSPGFWSTHGGFERSGPNITQAVLDAVGGVEVCGVTITGTSNTGSPYLDGLGLDSALEGLCMRAEGERQRQLYRQLIAAALNCAISGSEDCDTTVGTHTDVSFDECNSLCAGEDVGSDGPTIGNCIGELDCYNNGGEIIDGDCALGNCSVTGELCGDDSGDCPDVNDVPQECEAFPGNCHDTEFCQEEIDVCPARLGPASSRKACKEARGNDCTVDSCN